MSLADKLHTMDLLVKALEANRDYWRDKAVRQKEALSMISEMLLDADRTSDEILSCLEIATQSHEEYLATVSSD